MTAADIFQEYRMISAAEEYEAKKKHLVDEWREDEVLIDSEFEQYKRSQGFGD